ncbi:glycosyltransferase family 4 protein [Blastopirellula retiformator]|uniref:Glycosyl transferases group 1 n=1 Tax=Blastopirellula retiformator TaxID=2527970 RepID=A0A5C5V9N1_9BACT|nr:glycosyltransferase family 4 protein [Blastopirellula retiformator]TWT34633.1 Glycosyl transferases group 1 [Blastopirellula retiformator]
MLNVDGENRSRLRIVLVMIEPPLPFGNAAGRWFYALLKGLVERGHHVTALAACSNPDDIERSRELFPAPKYDLRLFRFPHRRGLATKMMTIRRPYSYMFSDELIANLRQRLAEGYDVLHMEHLWCGWLTPEDAAKTLINIHYLFSIDLAEIPRQGWRQWIDHQLMLRGERMLLQGPAKFLALSDRIAGAIRDRYPAASVDVVPLGMDLDKYDYIADEERTAQPVISVIGSMGWYPSRSAAERLLRDLWPRIKERVPNAKVQIVGWEARSALAEYLDMPDVEIHENVPEILPYFRHTAVLLYAPGRGSGMKVKVLESFALGVPVVTTSEGVEGIPVEDGVHAFVTGDDDEEAMVERTVQLLQSVELQNRHRQAARQLLEERCSDSAALDCLEAAYARLIATPA